MPVPQKQIGVWKPRCLMQNANRASTVPNINDQEMFPTFEAAEKIEKLKKDDEKKRSALYFVLCRNCVLMCQVLILFCAN